MALTPAEIRALQFGTVKRGGYDQREVESFRTAAANSLEVALQESTAMEARARAAVARLQELVQQPPASESADQAPAADGEEADGTSAPGRRPLVAVAESETISRTLLLAQRTADTTVAEAEQEARDRLDAADAEASRIVEDAKAESRRAAESERVRVEGEVQALLARRDFLESDVDQLEQHLQAQRERITEVVVELGSITSRVPNGLGPMRRPQLSASDHSGEQDRPDDLDQPEADDDDDIDVSSLIDQTQAQAQANAGAAEPGAGEFDSTEPENHTLFTPEEPR